MILPTLFKKASTGKIQQWSISVQEIAELVPPDGGSEPAYPTIITVHGQVGGKLQRAEDPIKSGKNEGKKNETTPTQQACAEAKAKWEKQLKKGYVDSIEKAQGDETDDLIEGGILPMLAHKFAEQAHKIKYPAAAQPKLDGIRCIAIVKDGECTLWSRTRKPINSCPHIVQEIEALFGHEDIILDGELYNHSLKKDFEKIVSMVRQEEPAEGCEIVEYHVYDVAAPGTFQDRFNILAELMNLNEPYYLKLVPTQEVATEEDIMRLFSSSLDMGFEGLMVRNANSPYVNKRSYDLQKVKEFDEEEFKITGVTEGRGKLAGHAIFVCVDSKGDEFEAKLDGDTGYLKTLFENHDLWKGKKLTVQFQGLTGAKKVPRFPVGKAIRDYE